MTANEITIEPATPAHLEELLELEQRCFVTDRLSRRSMRRFLANEQSVFRLALQQGRCIGYVLIVFHLGTRLARMYSLAVAPEWQGHGVARKLISSGEEETQDRGALYIRLEVNNTNERAIALYQKLGYIKFGLLHDYYEDHSDALRMQKRIRFHDKAFVHTALPWYQQRTRFTCGPAALMMAMAGLKPGYGLELDEELQLWREATTIFMTSGHGGCHPLGLALAAKRRGYNAEVWINQRQPLFVEGVRSQKKKTIIETVHRDFVRQCKAEGIKVHYKNISQPDLIAACNRGSVPVVLISTYRMDRKKAAHWVAVSGYDEQCFYMHDPDPDEKHQDQLDCQYLPIALEDFDPMSSYGRNRLRTAVIISNAS
jgi:ribosomal-protein-alanine acetyltransferase